MVKNNIILTDCDGVLCNWEWAFNIWMQEQGYVQVKNGELIYRIGDRYNLPESEGRKLVKIFNESASIGFLPPLRDAIHYVKKLHEEHGFVFHCITSLSKNRNAKKLREMNLNKLFGETVFEEIVCLGTGEDKNLALAPYRNSELFWVEDKLENAEVGQSMGLKSIIMEHGFNMHYSGPIPKVKNWAQIYDIVVKS